MEFVEEDWEGLFPVVPRELNILDDALNFFDEQELFRELPKLMEEDRTAISDDDQDWARHAALHDHPYAAKEPQDQTPGPLYAPPVPNVIHEQKEQYVELPNFTPSAKAVPAMTCHGIPVFAAGWNTAPTIGGQKGNDCGFMVQSVPLVKTLLPVNDPVSRKEENVADEPYIKKPPNAFMRFLKQNRKSAEAELGVRTSAVVNKYLGQRWKSLLPEERETYVIEAKVDSLFHYVANDGWSNKNNYGKKRKRKWTKVVHTKEITPASIGQ